jgi:ribosomal protein L31
MRKNIKIMATITSMFIFVEVSFSAHPLITDDTGVQGKNNWHL